MKQISGERLQDHWSSGLVLASSGTWCLVVHSHFQRTSQEQVCNQSFHLEPPLMGELKFIYKWCGSHDQDGNHAHIW